MKITSPIPKDGCKFYFGTSGKNSGHHFYPLNFDGRLDDKEEEFIDSHRWLSIVQKQGPYIVYPNKEYTVYAVPFSANDDRPGSHTEFWWEGEHSKEDMLRAIAEYPLTMQQFAPFLEEKDIFVRLDKVISVLRNTDYFASDEGISEEAMIEQFKQCII